MFSAVRSILTAAVGLLVEDGRLALSSIAALAIAGLAASVLGDATGWLLLALVLAILFANVVAVGLRLRRRA